MYKKIMYLPDMGYLRTLFTYALCMSTLLSPHNDNFSAAVKFRWKIYCKRPNTPFRRWFAFGCRWKTTAFDTPATSRWTAGRNRDKRRWTSAQIDPRRQLGTRVWPADYCWTPFAVPVETTRHAAVRSKRWYQQRGPKRKPLPNYQLIVLNRIKAYQWDST